MQNNNEYKEQKMISTNECTVRLITTPDSDLKVVNSARVSFAKEVQTLGVDDEGLIKFLATHKHWTPFSHCRDIIAIKVESTEQYVKLLSFFTLTLNQAEKTSMVIKLVEGVLYIKHSLYGWANVVNKAMNISWKHPMADTPIERGVLVDIVNMLFDKYPVSAQHLLTETSKAIRNHDAQPSLASTDQIEGDVEFIDITMYESVPIAVARQRFKHMVGTTYNEVSRRYVDSEPVIFVPDVWRGRHDSKKQGSREDAANAEPEFIDKLIGSFEACVDLYNEAIVNDVCPEQARFVLPQSMMTEYFVTANLAAWERLLAQRLEGTAQLEIQHYAQRALDNIRLSL